ncbi:hypothetical protein ISS37_01515 [candidate division KSB1 bacterium]|nr:hypothetical protein [candidate division KSB1 bacterium]
MSFWKGKRIIKFIPSKTKFLFLLFWFGLFGARLLAGILETLPTYHWAYGHLDELRTRGYFSDLFVLNKPYTRGEVALGLLEIQEAIDLSRHFPTREEQWLIDRLQEEFRPEIEELKSDEGVTVKLGALIEGDGNVIREGGTTFRSRARSKIGVMAGEHLVVFNGMILDPYLADDATYIGKRWRDMAAYTEQAYLFYRGKYVGIKLGRDFLKWGSGRSGNLLISDHSRPFDLLLLQGRTRLMGFTFFTAELDTRDGARRYLAAHRLDLALSPKLNLGFTEVILYGGDNRTLELRYLNPFLLFHGVQNNDPGAAGNTLGCIDFDFFPRPNFEFYGEFLVDDFQVDKKEPGDLEPNELGWLVGFQWADFLGVGGSNLGIEYTGVTNRTYNTPNRWEKFLHRNRPIGYFLGNDFDRWQVRVGKWMSPLFKTSVEVVKTRRGEGRVEADWDTPWLDYTVAEGYHEDFPFGIVERTWTIRVMALYQPSANLNVSFQLDHSAIKNRENQLGENDKEINGKISLYLNVDRFFD